MHQHNAEPEPITDFYTRIADYLSNLLAQVETEQRVKSAPKVTQAKDSGHFGWQTVALRRR